MPKETDSVEGIVLVPWRPDVGVRGRGLSTSPKRHGVVGTIALTPFDGRILDGGVEIKAFRVGPFTSIAPHTAFR